MENKDIIYLNGIGEKRAETFKKMGIKTLWDLLCFFPRTYEDRSSFKDVADCRDNEEVCIRAEVRKPVEVFRTGRNMTISVMVVGDESGILNIVWYNNRFVKGQYHMGEKYTFFGKIVRNKYGKRQMVNPVVEKIGKENFTGKIVPLYPLSGNLTQKVVQKVMETALKEAGKIDEFIPDDLRQRYELCEINFAMENIHFPKDFNSYNISRRRFVFEELLILQLALLSRKSDTSKQNGIVFEDISCVNDFIKSLPFPLTGAQDRTLKEILNDLNNGKMMNRLVQGDVGSGKTAVAAAAIYTAVKNGHQAAMMAPTEILAQQHKDTLDAFFDGMGINIVLLSGGMSVAKKREAYEFIDSGFADVVIGTHALIEDKLRFNDLSLVVTDEQHRFGVEQRAALAAKGHNPHMLIMSATPIPRTLALILYGDLDISIIDELPPGRKQVKTYAVGENMRKRIYAFVKKNADAGSQVYIVCPLVEETETSDLQNAADLSKNLEVMFPEFNIGLIHGKMCPKDKEKVMADFADGKIHILVSTTVIEVGVNVPNANVMVIENAERFGLSQLHQLRGRVGRGKEQAYCVLFAHGNNEIAKKRMKTMCLSNDGFYISEQDLKLRGPGDFFGTRQHGLPAMKIANLFEDSDILRDAQEAVKEILKEDRNLTSEKYRELKKRTDRLLQSEIVMN